MSWFKLAIFLHITGVLGLFAAQALEMAGVLMLRRASSVGQIRDAGMILGKLDRLFGSTSALILLSGIYLLIYRINKHESIGWVIVAIVLFVIMAVFGSLTGRRTGEGLKSLARESEGKMTDGLQAFARSNPAQASAAAGPFAVLGILALMVFHPSVWVSILVLVVALLIGWLVATRLGFYRPSPRTRLRKARA